MVSLWEMGFSAGKRIGGGEADARENNFRPVSAHLDREGRSLCEILHLQAQNERQTVTVHIKPCAGKIIFEKGRI